MTLRNFIKVLASIIFILIIGTEVSAQEKYPFDLPQYVHATMDIDTTSTEVFNDLLLGYNIHHFSTAEEKDMIRYYDPITVRFPHGLWANWYDWRQDKTRLFGEERFDYWHQDKEYRETEVGMLSTIRIFEQGSSKIGIDGLTTLNTEKKNRDGEGYDMMWTFNMSADGPDFTNGSPETVARYHDLISRGLEVKAIELGNENFYPGQRSSIIPDSEDYIARAKSMSQALKAIDPAIKVSVPLLRRDSWANPSWNYDLTEDQSYYDAVTVHTYVGSDPDNAANSDEAFGTALTARKSLHSSLYDSNYAKVVAPTKPIWLTEWGVKSGGPNAASVLGMADAYIYFSENQDIWHRANWFSVNGKLNSFLVWHEVDVNGTMRPRIKYPLEKTLFGSTYEVIRSVFENSILLESSMKSPKLEDGINAISARALVKDDTTTVFVLNMTDRTVPFTIKLNGAYFVGDYHHQAITFSALAEERVLPIDESPYSLESEGDGTVALPKYSINVLKLKTLETSTEPILSAKPGLKETQGFNIFPNPASDQFSIHLNGIQPAWMSVYSINGKLLYHEEVTDSSRKRYKDDRFKSGVYLVEIISEDQKRYSQKLVIQ